jgi:peptidoglycan/xylan/chitin deacetylase (PgdA/CDA1 family)
VTIEHRHGIEAKLVALTFDDGPSVWTEPILDLLSRRGATATFFVIGSAVAARPEVARRVLERGHELGNHTFDHPHLTQVPDDGIRSEIERTTKIVRTATGLELGYWRPPYFDCDERVRRAVEPSGLEEIGCSVVTHDYEWPAEQTIAFVGERLRPGAIVDLHDGCSPHDTPPTLTTRDETVRALAAILDLLDERGLRCVTVSELLAAS